MDGAALATPWGWGAEAGILPSHPDEEAVTPPKGEAPRDFSALAMELAAVRASLEATETRMATIGTTLDTLRSDFISWKASGPEAAKLKWTSATVYSLLVTMLFLASAALTLYQAADAKARDNRTEIHDMQVRREADKQVEIVEQRLRDFKESIAARDAERVEKLAQLSATYITTLRERKQ